MVLNIIQHKIPLPEMIGVERVKVFFGMPFDVRHPTFAKYAIGAGSAVAGAALAKILIFAIKYVCKRIQKWRQSDQVWDVLIFNERSMLCNARHLKDLSFECKNEYCSTRNTKRIVDELDQAKYSIDIAMYIFTLNDLMKALTRAKHRNVQVRIICDHEMNCSSGSRILSLNQLGIEIRSPDTTAMMHHKFLVIDNPIRVNEILLHRDGKSKPCAYRSMVLYGSLNWTMQAFGGNWENCVITTDSVLGREFQTEFSRMWKAFEYSLSNVKAKA